VTALDNLHLSQNNDYKPTKNRPLDMARKQARRMAPRRRRNNGIKILNIAEGYLQANIVTQKLMNVNPIEFIAGSAGPTLMATNPGGISLLEIAKDPSLIETIGKRATNPETLLNIAVMSAVTNVGFKFAKRALRRPVNMLNRTVFRPLALGVSL